jgi:hypothetical protein
VFFNAPIALKTNSFFLGISQHLSISFPMCFRVLIHVRVVKNDGMCSINVHHYVGIHLNMSISFVQTNVNFFFFMMKISWSNWFESLKFFGCPTFLSLNWAIKKNLVVIMADWKSSIVVWNIFQSHLEKQIGQYSKKFSLSINNSSIFHHWSKDWKFSVVTQNDYRNCPKFLSNVWNIQLPNMATKNWQLNFVNKFFWTLHTKNVIVTQKISII